MNKLFCFVAALFLLLCKPAFAGDVEMQSLMQLFAANKNIKSEFVEKKYLRILDSPVESAGELVFLAPFRLEKNTKLPRPEKMLIEGNKVSIERGSFKRTMLLDESTDINSMIQSLVATFRGDQAGIEKYFVWTLTGPVNKWRLVLKPKTSKLFVTLREIQLSGENSYVHTVETTLSDGDRSLMTLSRPSAMPAQ